MVRLDGARREAITRAADRLYEAIVPEILERLAQAADVHVDGAFLHVHVAAPDAIKQLIARVHALRVRHEELEHAVFGGPERHRTLADRHPVASLIEDQAVEFDELLDASGTAPPQHGVDAQHQVGARIRQGGACGAAILRFPDLETGAFQAESDHFADRTLVLDDQYLFGGHGVDSAAARLLQRLRVADS